jgi:hypothetical protein
MNSNYMDFEHDFTRKQWALLYLHDWDPPTEARPNPVWPEIHGVYDDERTAIENRQAMTDPSKYYVQVCYTIVRKKS